MFCLLEIVTRQLTICWWAQVIVSEVGRVKEGSEERFLDPRSKKTFVFDHLRLVGVYNTYSCYDVYSSVAYRKRPIRSHTNLMRKQSHIGA